MSRETALWLNTRTLIGHTDVRGNAWHYRAEQQGEQSNHYPGAIPIEDVRSRLFNWHAVEGTVRADVVSEDGAFSITDPTRKAILRPPGAFGEDDRGQILGLFKSGYQIHQFDEWLLTQVAAILDDDLTIGSAGLLKAGAAAWVQVEVPESIVTPSGIEFRPHLLAATSLDGTLATTYKRCVQVVVCDNTMEAGLGEQGQQFKVKHSRYSDAKLGSVRDALEIVHTVGEDFTRQVEELTNTTVTDDQWSVFLESLAPRSDENGNLKEGRGLTIASNKQAGLQNLWNTDERVMPWKNTAFGVMQAVNTFEHHLTAVSKSSAERGERNMLRAVSGETGKTDRSTMDLLATILA